MRMMFPGVRERRTVDRLLTTFFREHRELDFRRGIGLLGRFYHLPRPRVRWFEYLDWGKTAGRTYENGDIHLVHPESWKRGRKYNSERQWIHTVYHEFGHYVLWADAERKEDGDRARDVLGAGEAAARVAAAGLLEEVLGSRDLARGGRVGHPGADGVDGDARRPQLERELPHVGLERRLGRRHRPVERHDARAARAGHGEDVAPLAEETARVEVLDPVDEAVRHHVERHLELRLGGLLPRHVAHEGLERPERERMQEHAQRLPARQLARALADLDPLLVVGRVDVEEVGRGPGGAHVLRHGLGLRQRDLTVQVHPDDAHAAAAELAGRGGTEAARGAQDEPPRAREGTPGIVVRHTGGR